MGHTEVVCSCQQCNTACVEADLNECVFCSFKYCYKCDGDCPCYVLARTVMILNTLKLARDGFDIQLEENRDTVLFIGDRIVEQGLALEGTYI